jgi:hypothetical protein
MSPSTQDGFSVLALDIGTVHTRALLFEVVEESYRFIASSVTQTTLSEPVNDIVFGILDAIHELQGITGHIFFDSMNNLVVPSQVDGIGVDRLYVAYSICKPLRIATFGLIEDVSQLSINKLAATIPGRIVESIGLNDPRTVQQQIDNVLAAQPELVLFAGGTDRGATRSVKKMANLISAVIQLMPQNARPPVLFAGNRAVSREVKEILSAYTRVNETANIRPDMDHEDVTLASDDLARMYTDIQMSKLESSQQISTATNDTPCPASNAIGRIASFLSKVNDPEKGVLAIDLGSAATIAASAQAGELSVNVFPFGSGFGFERFLRDTRFNEISQWFSSNIDPEEARNQLWQKTLFPASIPMTFDALEVEQAAYRQMLRTLMRELAARGAICANGYETIICSGAALTKASSAGQLLLMLLDGLQPHGISNIILDSYSILSTLGVISRTLPILPIQVLESSAFANLATVVSVDSNLRVGSPVLKAVIEYKNGKSTEITVKQGSLVVVPIRTGDTAQLELQVNRNARVDANELDDNRYKINGGLCGLVIDARGRPLRLPSNASVRSELFARWKATLKSK